MWDSSERSIAHSLSLSLGPLHLQVRDSGVFLIVCAAFLLTIVQEQNKNLRRILQTRERNEGDAASYVNPALGFALIK